MMQAYGGVNFVRIPVLPFDLPVELKNIYIYFVEQNLPSVYLSIHLSVYGCSVRCNYSDFDFNRLSK